MLLGGDELSRTQRGNDNAYCQDNDIGWYSWNLDDSEKQFLAFVQRLVRLRRDNPVLRGTTHLYGEVDSSGVRDAVWCHSSGREMKKSDWPRTRCFGLQLSTAHDRLLLLCNASKRAVSFSIPPDVSWKDELTAVGDLFRLEYQVGAGAMAVLSASVLGVPPEPAVQTEGKRSLWHLLKRVINRLFDAPPSSINGGTCCAGAGQ